MFSKFQDLHVGLLKTVENGDCFFDALGLFLLPVWDKRVLTAWRQDLVYRMYKQQLLNQAQYNHYVRPHVWADFDLVIATVRLFDRPFCVIQYEIPNAVTLIRPYSVEWTPEQIVYLVYCHGNHFTTFSRHQYDIVKRLKRMEQVGMPEEQPGCVVTHGNLSGLLEDTRKRSSRKTRKRV